MKKTTLALSILALSACSQTSDNPLLLTIDDQALPFQSTGQGTLIAEHELSKGTHTFSISDAAQTCGTSYALAEESRVKFNKPLRVDDCAEESQIDIKIFKANTYQFTLNPQSNELTVKVKPKQKKVQSFTCPVPSDSPTTVDVTKTFADGTLLRDALSGQQATVTNGTISMKPANSSQ